VNTLTVVEPAVIPTQSTNPSPVLSIALAMILGAFIATAGAYLLELLDRRANTPQDVYRMLNWQPLAEIETMADQENVATYVATYPQSSVANSFRAAKTGLELAGVGREIRSMLVTGPSASDGKSTISQNLAISFAMGKHRVLLIKGDFYGENEPIENGRGLSDLLVDGGDPEQTLISTPQDNLYILHAGTQTEQAIDLLNKTRLRQILNSLKKSFDVIIMDGPPTFVSDTKVLSASSDGVLVVIRMARSPLDAIDRMKEQFESLDIEPLGVILNDTSRTPVYYQSYYSQRPMPAWQVGLSRLWSGLKSRLGKAQIGRLGKQVYSDDGHDFKT
jgi:capsular exopolysaccharide synthesis family protein